MKQIYLFTALLIGVISNAQCDGFERLWQDSDGYSQVKDTYAAMKMSCGTADMRLIVIDSINGWEMKRIKSLNEYLTTPDWNATTGRARILNKPTLFSGSYLDLTNKPTIPTAGAVFLSNTTVSQTAIVALLGGVRKVTITGVTGILSGDRVLLTPTGSTPSGYALADVVATAANTLEVSFTAPALALGASFSIPCKVTVFR